MTRSLLPVAALAAALTICVTGCQGASSTVAGAGLSSTPPSSAATAPAVSASPVSAPTSAAVPSQPAAPGAPPAPVRVVYLAEGGSVTGTVLYAPACRAGCMLSGDSTTSLWDMAWPAWNSAAATGTGTEKLDDCTPNCAAGTLHPVPVKVTLSRPVMICGAGGAGRWFWTRVSFTWPAGLPAAFSGGNAPLNPFDYPGLASQAAKSCP